MTRYLRPLYPTGQFTLFSPTMCIVHTAYHGTVCIPTTHSHIAFSIWAKRNLCMVLEHSDFFFVDSVGIVVMIRQNPRTSLISLSLPPYSWIKLYGVAMNLMVSALAKN